MPRTIFLCRWQYVDRATGEVVALHEHFTDNHVVLWQQAEAAQTPRQKLASKYFSELHPLPQHENPRQAYRELLGSPASPTWADRCRNAFSVRPQ